MVIGKDLDAWIGAGIEMRIRDPDEAHTDYFIALPAFDVEATGATLDDAIGAAFTKLDAFISALLPQPYHSNNTDTGAANGVDEK